VAFVIQKCAIINVPAFLLLATTLKITLTLLLKLREVLFMISMNVLGSRIWKQDIKKRIA